MLNVENIMGLVLVTALMATLEIHLIRNEVVAVNVK
jgi:hypothetical protein